MGNLCTVAGMHAYDRQHDERTGQRKETEKYESLKHGAFRAYGESGCSQLKRRVSTGLDVCQSSQAEEGSSTNLTRPYARTYMRTGLSHPVVSDKSYWMSADPTALSACTDFARATFRQYWNHSQPQFWAGGRPTTAGDT
jgi:hypothetical protein